MDTALPSCAGALLAPGSASLTGERARSDNLIDYQGMIIGENSRSDDLDVNPLKGKQLTNIRSAGKDEAVRLRETVLNPSFRKKRVREDA